MNIAIIGAGLIGRKRALALPKNIHLKTICDINKSLGEKFAKEFRCDFEREWQKVIDDQDIQTVFVCTTNNYLAIITQQAIKQGKNVLVEKPGGRNLKELQKTYQIHKTNPVVVMYGYNHRYHPSIQKAKQIADSNEYGPVLFIRARYGHGGRLGYEKEWRCQRTISGGGELIDQGCHLIDLTNFFCGEMNQITGYTADLFWNTVLDDSAFFQLRNKSQISHLSVTCLEWKNIFSFEIMLQKAKIQIDGLGGSYGEEKLILYSMKPEMGLPDVSEFTFEKADRSWEYENDVFFNKIKQKDYSDTNIKDAIYVMRIIEKLYKKNFV